MIIFIGNDIQHARGFADHFGPNAIAGEEEDFEVQVCSLSMSLRGGL
jgi:hypothetical protein